MIDFFKKNMDYFKKFILAVSVIAVYKTFDNLTSIFHSFGMVFKAATPFFAALVIAYMLNLPVMKLSELVERIKHPYFKKHSYGISILVIYILAALVLSITISAVVPAIYQNIFDLTFALPNYIMQVIDKLQSLEAVKALNLEGNMPSADVIMSSVMKVLNLNDLGGYIVRVFSMTSSVVNVFIAIIGSVYMLLDKKRIIAALQRLVRLFFKPEKAESILKHSSRVNTIFTKYIYCRLICSVICGTVCGIVLSIMGIKYALILSIFIGAMDMIPYFGSIISCIVAIVINLITGGLWQTVWLGVALLVIQQLDGNLLAPKLMGDSLELRPLWIVVTVFVGGKLFGFLGMLLSVPVLAVLRAVIGDYLEEYKEKRMAADVVDDWEDLK